MKTQKLVLTALTLAVMSTGAFANELLVTSEKSARGQVSALDFVSEGNATAIQARFTVDAGASAVLTGCAKALPSSHAGQCAYSKGVLTVLVYSDTNALLPKGIVSLGTIGFKGGNVSPKLTELLAFDAAGNKVQVSESAENARGSSAK